jgi:hypothetical protein
MGYFPKSSIWRAFQNTTWERAKETATEPMARVWLRRFRRFAKSKIRPKAMNGGRGIRAVNNAKIVPWFSIPLHLAGLAPEEVDVLHVNRLAVPVDADDQRQAGGRFRRRHN